MKKKQNIMDYVYGLILIFVSSTIFVGLFVIIVKYGVTSAFFQFENFEGTWEVIINVGIFWVIGMRCIDEFYNGLEKLKGGIV